MAQRPRFVLVPTHDQESSQRFACERCPARCCRTPWAIRLGRDEQLRLLAEPAVRERAGAQGAALLARGVLPMREVERRLQCVFLDDDELCGLQKAHGHSFIPRSCQTFPFGFVDGAGSAAGRGAALVQLSHYCPSVRDDYGSPVAAQLPAKLQQHGDPERPLPHLGTLGGRKLPRAVVELALDRWSALLAERASPLQALADAFDWTTAFEAELAPIRELDVSAGRAAAARAEELAFEPLAARRRSGFHSRMLYAYQLGNLAYPSRALLPHRVGASAPGSSLRAALGKLAWVLELGSADLLFCPAPVRLHRVGAVARFLAGGAHAARVGRLLAQVIARRHLLVEHSYLMLALLDLAFGAVLLSRFARLRATSERRREVSDEDVAEAVSVSELLVFSHARTQEQGMLMRHLRLAVVANRAAFRRLLAVES